MNCDTIISLIVNIDKYSIPSANTNHRSWKAFIYNQHAFCATQSCKIFLSQLQEEKKNIGRRKTRIRTTVYIYQKFNGKNVVSIMKQCLTLKQWVWDLQQSRNNVHQLQPNERETNSGKQAIGILRTEISCSTPFLCCVPFLPFWYWKILGRGPPFLNKLKLH